MDKSSLPKPIPTAIAVGITLLIWFVIPVPDKVSPNAWHLLALFIGTIAAIIGKAMPIGALSIVAISLVAITEVTRHFAVWQENHRRGLQSGSVRVGYCPGHAQ
jgi:DASS family divalent anion:Na+ symporter